MGGVDHRLLSSEGNDQSRGREMTMIVLAFRKEVLGAA